MPCKLGRKIAGMECKEVFVNLQAPIQIMQQEPESVFFIDFLAPKIDLSSTFEAEKSTVFGKPNKYVLPNRRFYTTSN